MNEVQVFNFEQFNVRTVMIDSEPYFVGKDVAKVLGYSNTRKALADHVDDDEKGGVTIRDSIGREQMVVGINESGVYSLTFGSKLDSAKRFKKWVTSEVLPSIRKTGGYQLSSEAFFLIDSEERMIEEQDAKNQRNLAMSRNSITKRVQVMYDVAEKISNSDDSDRLLDGAKDLLLNNMY